MSEDEIDRDVGGVQGTEDEAETRATPVAPDTGTTVVVPDAGEIEWAGELVKKAPGAPES